MKHNIVIRHTETGEHLAAIYIGCSRTVPPLLWRKNRYEAIHFENEEEAKATIKFIGDVIDWEMEEQLEIITHNSENIK